MSFIDDNNPDTITHREWNWRFCKPAAAPAPPGIFEFFYGIDGNGSNLFPPGGIPNSELWFNIFQDFVTLAGGSLDVQDFEGFAFDTPAPLAFVLNPGAAISVGISGAPADVLIKQNTPPFSDGNGRYSIPINASTKFLQAGAGINSLISTITFSPPVNGTGMYATDVGDFNVDLRVVYYDQTDTIIRDETCDLSSIPLGARDGDCLFIGLCGANSGSLISKVELYRVGTGVGADAFGFDLLYAARIP